MKQRIESFWDQQPCNVRHSLVDIDADPLAYSVQVTARKYRVEPHIPGFAQFERWAGKWVLDAGCGIGTDTISFAQAGAHVTAVDISGKSLEIARKRVEAHGLGDRVQFYRADLENMLGVIPIRAYDLVYSFGVLHHTPNPRQVVMQLWDFYTHGDSALKVMLYNRYSWKVFWILLTHGRGRIWDLDRLVDVYSEAQKGSPVSRIYSRRSARELLDGFDIQEMRVDHIFPYYIPACLRHAPVYVEYERVKEWYWRVCPALLFRLLERLFGWHLLVTARRANG